jgi:hypothetical protein
MDSEFPCKCGHSENNHIMTSQTMMRKFDKFIECTYCDCDFYKADNLKYLEQRVS